MVLQQASKKESSCLKEITERQRLDGGNLFAVVARGSQVVSCLGKRGGALQIDLDSCLACLILGSLVRLLACQDFLLALGFSDMLDSDMNTLLDDTSIDKLVHTDSNSRLGDVKDDSGTSVVSLVGHTLVNGRIGKDVHIVANLDVHEVLRKVDRSMFPMLLSKHVARTRPYTIGVRHLY
jgi:hypothetical protein